MSYRKLVRILNEVRYEDRFTVGELLKKYPNDYVHFGGGFPRDGQRSPFVPKFGIRPIPGHKDPPGLYVYPVNWLLTKSKGRTLYQMDLDHFAIIRFNKNAPGVLILNDSLLKDFRDVAQRNGWLVYFERCLKNPKRYLKYNRMDPELWRLGRPGPIFYGCADTLVNSPEVFGKTAHRFSWLKLLKGVKALIDEGEGIIDIAEPAQAVVIDPGAYKIIETGHNKPKNRKIAVDIFTEVVKHYKGSIEGWKKKFLYGSFTYNNGKVRCRLGFEGYPFYENINIVWYSEGKRYKNIVLLRDGIKNYRKQKNDIVGDAVLEIDRKFEKNPPDATVWKQRAGSSQI